MIETDPKFLNIIASHPVSSFQYLVESSSLSKSDLLNFGHAPRITREGTSEGHVTRKTKMKIGHSSGSAQGEQVREV